MVAPRFSEQLGLAACQRTIAWANHATELAQDGGPQLDGQVTVDSGAGGSSGLCASRASLAVRLLHAAAGRLHTALELLSGCSARSACL